MLDHPAVKRFIQLVESWNSAGWGELLLWETLEGKREKPFLFLPPLLSEDLTTLKALRDKHKIWPTCVMGTWELMDITVWRVFAKEHPADSVRDRLHEAR